MITQKEFGKYLAVQNSGVTNMFDVRAVSSMTGLSKEKLLYIMRNYSELKRRLDE